MGSMGLVKEKYFWYKSGDWSYFMWNQDNPYPMSFKIELK